MNKQRMLSAMMLGIALNITTPNCTTQTMLSVNAKPNPTKTMYTTTRVNVRVKPTVKSKKIKTLNPNTKIKVVKKCKNGWTKIKFKGKNRYICSKYLSKKKVSNRWKIRLNDGEIDLLTKIVYHEARGESNKGQQAVTEIVLNRMVDKEYPDTLTGVVSQKGQFESYKLIGLDLDMKAYKKCKKNVKKVLRGKTDILPKSYLYFSVGGHASHNGMIKIGNHQFCQTY